MIIIKTEKEIETMREGGRILAGIMDELGRAVVPGINTQKINKLARKLVFANGGSPIFEGYGGPENPYPAAVCTSINDEIVHGIPGEGRFLKKGDILKLDIGMKYKGLITDMARTFPVGKISFPARNLIKATREGLGVGLEKIRPGARLSEYSVAVDGFIRSQGFSVVRELVGHGVGRELHEDPQIPNYKTSGKDIVLKEGMTLALEPMVNEGTEKIKLMPDGWTFATADGKLSAHFEDTVVILGSGVEILTRIDI